MLNSPFLLHKSSATVHYSKDTVNYGTDYADPSKLILIATFTFTFVAQSQKCQSHYEASIFDRGILIKDDKLGLPAATASVRHSCQRCTPHHQRRSVPVEFKLSVTN